MRIKLDGQWVCDICGSLWKSRKVYQRTILSGEMRTILTCESCGAASTDFETPNGCQGCFDEEANLRELGA